MDRIQYTYKDLYLCFWLEIQYRLNRKPKINKLKTCKLILILSIHENHIFEIQNRLNRKLTNLKLVCVLWIWAYQHYLIFTIDLSNLKLNKPRSSCKISSSSRLDPNAIQRAWLQLSARYELWRSSSWITMWKLQNTFVEVNHLLITWSNIWN